MRPFAHERALKVGELRVHSTGERNGEIVPDGGHSGDCQGVTGFDHCGPSAATTAMPAHAPFGPSTGVPASIKHACPHRPPESVLPRTKSSGSGCNGLFLFLIYVNYNTR